VVICAAGFASTTSASAHLHGPPCLGSDETGADFDFKSHPECAADPLHLSSKPQIQAAEKMVGVDPNEITFIGCKAVRFQTYPDPLHHFKITYRNLPNVGFAEIIAPLLHEIGHVYQLKKAGSIDKLFQPPFGSLVRVELGADFLAGCEARELGIDPDYSQGSLDLVGNYKPNPSHGLPEDRAEAFEYCYFGEPRHSSIEMDYKDFQANLFVQIKDSSGGL
jgi:hypothetical protein